MNREYETLDAVMTVGALILVACMVVGFFFSGYLQLPESVLPVLSSLATAILGIPTAYAAFRWGNNVGAKHAAEAAAETSKAATGALAQIAGAGAPPPAAPFGTEEVKP